MQELIYVSLETGVSIHLCSIEQYAEVYVQDCILCSADWKINSLCVQFFKHVSDMTHVKCCVFIILLQTNWNLAH